jgi:hypothetical protein
MNTAHNKSALLNNSFTPNTQDKICNCLGCYRLATTKISLKVREKTVPIIICEFCKSKFE